MLWKNGQGVRFSRPNKGSADPFAFYAAGNSSVPPPFCFLQDNMQNDAYNDE